MIAPRLSTADVMYLQWLVENGKRFVKVLDGGRWAAVVPRLFTAAIQVGTIGDMHCVDDHWCYTNILEAQAALDAWDGVGEPDGWRRHPRTGRRVSRSASEVDENGWEVGAVGAAYVRP